jgi:GntR family transcriptional regulator
MTYTSYVVMMRITQAMQLGAAIQLPAEYDGAGSWTNKHSQSGGRPTMPDRFSTRPLYLQLRDTLTERIARGEWKPGRDVPSEVDLAREFGVGQGSVRKALQLLESDGLIAREQGRGTCKKRLQDLADRFNTFRLTIDVAARCEASTRDVVLAEASKGERARLQLVKDDKVYRISRICSHLGRAFMNECPSLPAALFPQLAERILPSHQLVEIAQDYSVLLGKGEERISLGTCSPSAAEALNLTEGTQVLILDRVIWTHDGRPAEWRRAECIPDGMYYKVQLD